MLIAETFLQCVSAQNLSYKYTEIKTARRRFKNLNGPSYPTKRYTYITHDCCVII